MATIVSTMLQLQQPYGLEVENTTAAVVKTWWCGL
jgi:hypothetical protein